MGRKKGEQVMFVWRFPTKMKRPRGGNGHMHREGEPSKGRKWNCGTDNAKKRYRRAEEGEGGRGV